MRALGLIATMAVILGGVLLGFWATKTYTLDTPYDEVWIGLNSRLPGPMRAWSCGAMHERLGAEAGVAPYGCEGLW